MMRKELEKRKLWDETVFMVCSEQGAQLPFAKWTCYDNGLQHRFGDALAEVTDPVRWSGNSSQRQTYNARWWMD